MREKMLFGVLVLFLLVLAGTPALYAEGDSLLTEESAGPALNEGVESSDPAVGASGLRRVFVEQDEENDSDPSFFEGDSESMPDERAPENMPMDDAPGVVGVGID